MSFGLGEASALGCAITWSIAVICFRRAGDGVPPRELNLFKNLLGLALFALTVYAREGRLLLPTEGAHVALLLFSGVLGIGVADALVFKCLNAIGATRWAIVECLYSPTVIAISVAFLGERLGLAQVLGTLLVLGAVLYVNSSEKLEALERASLRRGVLAGAAAIVTMVGGILMVEPLMGRMDMFWLIELRLAGGVLGSLVSVTLGRGLGAAWRSWGAAENKGYQLLACVLSVYVAMLMWVAGFKYADASVAAVLNQTGTIFTVLMAVWLLKEPSNRRTWIGTGLAFGGVLLTLGG